jgi:hypothetical protein
MGFMSVVNWANSVFSKYESDAQVAHFGWAAMIQLGLRLSGVPFWWAVLIAAGVGFVKQILIERVLAVPLKLVDPTYETWGHALRDTAMWMAGVAVAMLVPKR